MTEILKRLLKTPTKTSVLRGVGSVLDLAGSGFNPSHMIFRATVSPQDSVKNAWKSAMGQAITEMKHPR